MYHVDRDALRGKNFFQLMSSYSRKFFYETYSNNLFKTFKQKTKTMRFSLPHMDDVDFEHFHVITCKIMLVKSKVSSPLKTDPYMVKIYSRRASEESARRMFSNYTKARHQLRSRDFERQTLPFNREVPIVDPQPYYIEPAPSRKSAFNSGSTRNM